MALEDARLEIDVVEPQPTGLRFDPLVNVLAVYVHEQTAAPMAFEVGNDQRHGIRVIGVVGDKEYGSVHRKPLRD
jgi:hypothetical protein